MKKLTGDKDYLCVVGKPSDITANLNKISSLYDFTILSSAMDAGTVMVIVERRRKDGSAPEMAAKLPGRS